jgi:phosphoribosylamine--glycine ligase
MPALTWARRDPGPYEKGKKIKGLDVTTDCVVFHAGTKKIDNEIVTTGGRVLAVSAWGTTMEDALQRSYRNAGLISFEGSYYRNDIGFDL